MLAAFMGGLAVGFAAFEPLLASAYADGTAPIRFAVVRVAVSLALLGIPAAAMGATFPIAVSWLAHLEDSEARDGRRAALEGGVLYAVNTAGAAAGAIVAGFWLIPSFGIRATTWVAVALNVAAACGAWWLARAPRRRRCGACGRGALEPESQARKGAEPSRRRVRVARQSRVRPRGVRGVISLDPRDSSVDVNLGYFHLESADALTAAEYFSEALALDPNAEAAKRGLAQARGATP